MCLSRSLTVSNITSRAYTVYWVQSCRYYRLTQLSFLVFIYSDTNTSTYLSKNWIKHKEHKKFKLYISKWEI